MRSDVMLRVVTEADPQQGEGCEQSDEQLMLLAAARDARAFAALYDRYARIAYSVALRLMREASAAEDVVQDAFISLWRLADRFDAGRGSVRTYILSIVHHRAVDILRSARMQRQADAEPETLESTPDTLNVEHTVLHRIEARKLRAAVGHLPEEQRTIVELAYFHGYAYPEIASMLGIPLGTVKSRLRLAMGKLRAAPEMTALAGAAS
jgi:RNA polymerase sigma-70 factor (ECF subfamily)